MADSILSFLRSGWRLIPVIVKANDDLRQEQCVCQLVAQMHRILLAGSVSFCDNLLSFGYFFFEFLIVLMLTLINELCNCYINHCLYSDIYHLFLSHSPLLSICLSLLLSLSLNPFLTVFLFFFDAFS